MKLSDFELENFWNGSELTHFEDHSEDKSLFDYVSEV
jgi:hypothetical protein